MTGRNDRHPDAIIRAYMAGIDRSLLRDNLRLSHTDRLRRLQELQRLAEAARRAGRRIRRGR
jgi:hypothetical protein